MANLDRESIAIGTAAATNDSLMACDIARLEELFADCREDFEALRGLQDELRYRYSPNALALLKQIQDVLDAREQGGIALQVGMHTLASDVRCDQRAGE